MLKTYRLADVKAIKARDLSAPQEFVPAPDYRDLEVGYGVVLTEQPAAIEYVQECGCTAHLTTDERARHQQRPCPQHGGYSWALYGATRSNGGYVLMRFSYQQQRDSIRLYRLDDALRDYYNSSGGDLTMKCRLALERLAAVRMRLLTPPVVTQ